MKFIDAVALALIITVILLCAITILVSIPLGIALIAGPNYAYTGLMIGTVIDVVIVLAISFYQAMN